MSTKSTHPQATKKRISTKKKRRNYSKEKRVKFLKKQCIKTKQTIKIRDIFFLLILSFCFIFLFQHKTHRVSGSSMQPILENSDRIIVKKGQLPERYDVITFDPEIPDESSYVKRVIGIPGDQIWAESNAIYLRPQKAGKWLLNTANQISAEELPDSTLKVIVSKEVFQTLRDMHRIPEGNYVVLGDNRSASKDSRTMGLIKEKQIEGIVTYRYFPLTKIGRVK
ncbi:signal peptidase I [Enterococcus haemoperoxidus ATCC BAA-382]|uniref:Signal peptidase I n=1 Tax=Enterococcus haemoperoxidus ATCC BAA-382 TaxID=1158608 RepID=R2QB70_9ENTE|nr:signal peptidase I [Enterococcus haemoperoxidus]EOH92448.1 signal peptidase I [Enterococcus haemoperoxidus ATCC BAA-382]EOT61814.1 signal peptidase I [Enterococcus haemoperoxidus ATCC BAA-382]OJG53914.1 signal peptidase I [Enterococcus haemoperoxidus]